MNARTYNIVSLILFAILLAALPWKAHAQSPQQIADAKEDADIAAARAVRDAFLNDATGVVKGLIVTNAQQAAQIAMLKAQLQTVIKERMDYSEAVGGLQKSWGECLATNPAQ